MGRMENLWAWTAWNERMPAMNAMNALSRLKKLRSCRSRRGMSLVEIMIVLAIIGLMAGTVAFVAIPQLQKARVKEATNRALAIRGAVQKEQIDEPSSCFSATELKVKKAIQGDVNDPWGKAFKVVCEGDEVTVTSLGQDGKEGTEDDIVEPKPEKK